jgi:hypothetical protein
MPESPFPTFERMFPAFIKSWLSPTPTAPGGAGTTPPGTTTPTPGFVGGDDSGGMFDNFDSEKFRSAFRYNFAHSMMTNLFPEVHPVLLVSRLDGYTWHRNRHTFASRLAMAGADLYTIQRLGGWRTFKMVQRYAHLAPEHLREAVERLVSAPPASAASNGVGAPEVSLECPSPSASPAGVS